MVDRRGPNVFSDEFRDAALRWRARLRGPDEKPEEGGKDGRGDPGMLADMLRCRTVGDVLVTEAFSAFLSSIYPDAEERRVAIANTGALDGLARAAMVLPRARELNLSEPFGVQMARAKNARPTVPRGLAKGFFQTREADAALEQALRFTAMMDDSFNALDLARRMAAWGERTRARLALDYYDSIAAQGLDE